MMMSGQPRADPGALIAACFFEADAGISVFRRSLAEALGTMFLVLAVVGAGVTTQRLAPGLPAQSILMSAVVASSALVGLIFAFGSVSGGHFNPLITVLQWLSAERGLICTAAYITAQILGGLMGAFLATLLFPGALLPPRLATASPDLLLSELVASAGLMVVVFACSRSRLRSTGPLAVGAWLAAAIIALPSRSFANPALTVAALIAPGSVSMGWPAATGYVCAQLSGALIALAVVGMIFPHNVESGHTGAIGGVRRRNSPDRSSL